MYVQALITRANQGYKLCKIISLFPWSVCSRAALLPYLLPGCIILSMMMRMRRWEDIPLHHVRAPSLSIWLLIACAWLLGFCARVKMQPESTRDCVRPTWRAPQGQAREDVDDEYAATNVFLSLAHFFCRLLMVGRASYLCNLELLQEGKTHDFFWYFIQYFLHCLWDFSCCCDVFSNIISIRKKQVMVTFSILHNTYVGARRCIFPCRQQHTNPYALLVFAIPPRRSSFGSAPHDCYDLMALLE